MAGNHRSLTDLKNIIKRLVGDVRDIHHHAQMVHSFHYLLAEGTQAVVTRLVGGRVGMRVDHDEPLVQFESPKPEIFLGALGVSVANHTYPLKKLFTDSTTTARLISLIALVSGISLGQALTQFCE